MNLIGAVQALVHGSTRRRPNPDIRVLAEETANRCALGVGEHRGAEICGADRVCLVEQDMPAEVEARYDDPKCERQQECEQPELGGDDRADGRVALSVRPPGAQTPQAEPAFAEQEVADEEGKTKRPQWQNVERCGA